MLSRYQVMELHSSNFSDAIQNCLPVFLFTNYTLKSTCYSTTSFIHGRFSHIQNKTSFPLLGVEKSIHRIKPKQHPPVYAFPVKSATQYIKHVGW